MVGEKAGNTDVQRKETDSSMIIAFEKHGFCDTDQIHTAKLQATKYRIDDVDQTLLITCAVVACVRTVLKLGRINSGLILC